MRRAETQARWRASHPEYDVTRRIVKRAEAAEQAEEAVRALPPLPRVPRALARLPWGHAQDQFGTQAVDFAAQFGKVLLHAAQDQTRMQLLDTS